MLNEENQWYAPWSIGIMDRYNFELAKLVVTSEFQSKHIGAKFIEVVIIKVREQGEKSSIRAIPA